MPLSAEHDGQAASISRAGMLLNAVLTAAKLTTGLIGNSTALVADAAESATDILGSLIVWTGLRVAARPADSNHPYGHGRAEPLAALFGALLLTGVGVGIAGQAIRGILNPTGTPAAYTLGVLIAVVVVKEMFFRRERRVARQSGSSAVLLDAWHHRADAITSAAVAIGITIAIVGGPGYEVADAWAALFACCVILVNAALLLRQPLRELMDTEPGGLVREVRERAERVDGVERVEKVLARKHGLRYLVDMHIEVDPEMSVRDAHEVAHRVKDHVRETTASVRDVLVHVEPLEDAAPD